MKALRFHAPEDVRLEDVPEPECKPDEIKIKVRNCSTCGTDVKILHNGHQNITGVTTMGHEVAGEIVEIGSEVAGDWKIGDRVQSIAAVPCGECHECRKGWMQVCQNQTSVGYQYDGGFAEYMIVPPQVLKVDGLNRIPDGVDFDEASAAEPFACAINAQEQLGVEEGDFVVIFGAGMGMPYFSTDTTAAQRALEIGCEVLLMAKAVDGVYDSDPRENPDAKLYSEISPREVIENGLKVADATAISLCMDNQMPIVVFNLLRDGNIARATAGERIGTLISQPA